MDVCGREMVEGDIYKHVINCGEKSSSWTTTRWYLKKKREDVHYMQFNSNIKIKLKDKATFFIKKGLKDWEALLLRPALLYLFYIICFSE